MAAFSEIQSNLRHNFLVNVFDGAFFGFALGFASFTTILPLFVSSMTDSAVLIGLIPAIHTLGWQFPQLLTARRVARLTHLKPLVLWMTTQERIPFLGLALVAVLLPTIGPAAALPATFFLLIWQGLGAGLTANAWQNLIGKVIPGQVRGTFFGFQSGSANLLSSIGAVAAGLILERLPSPTDFALCFLICSMLMAVSWFFLAQTREPERQTPVLTDHQHPLWRQVLAILKSDVPFRWFLICRFMFQFGTMAFAFYVVYAVAKLGMSEFTAGVMTSVLLITQVVVNPLFGWLADRWSRKWVMVTGAFSAFASAILAWTAPSLSWFYAVFVLAGIANVVFWAVGMTFSLEFGPEEERPTYVGMANTLIAPGAIIAPLLGGWVADQAGYPSAFLLSAGAALLTGIMLAVFVTDTRRQAHSVPALERKSQATE